MIEEKITERKKKPGIRKMERYENGKPKQVLLSEICNIMGVPCELEDRYIKKIAHVTRNIEEGCLFFAFCTWRVDTYSNILKAMEKKAAAIVTEKYIEGYPCIVVGNAYQAFMNLGAWYKQQMDIDVIAVTGSIGKTSTKDMISFVISDRFSIEESYENGNSSDLAAMNIIDLKGTTEILLQEMAIQGIHDASMTLTPDVAVITNIGWSHVESFGSRQKIFEEKLKITDGMRDGSVLVLNIDDDMLNQCKSVGNLKIVTYAIDNKEADFRAENIKINGEGYCFDICVDGERKKYPARICCLGKHNVLNAVAAFAVGIQMGMEPTDIIEGIKKFRTTGFRQNIFKKNNITVLADCFNAAPDSIRTAINTLENIEVLNGGKRIAVLGDVWELGEYSEKLHREIGKFINNTKLDLLILIGKEVGWIEKEINSPNICVKRVFNHKQLVSLLKRDALDENNVILFKGSHGMELARVIDELFGTDYMDYPFEKAYVAGRLEREAKDIGKYFSKKGWKTAAVYGISLSEKELLKVFEKYGVHVKYAIDRKARFLPENIYAVRVVSPEDELEKADVLFDSVGAANDRIIEAVGGEVMTYSKLLQEIEEY